MLLAGAPARADGFDWSEDAGAIVEHGILHGLPIGPLRWRTGRIPADGIHQATAVEVSWSTPDGLVCHQTLFEEIQDGRPALRLDRGQIALRVTYCPAGGACRAATLRYGWDRRSGRFQGARGATQESLAAACGAMPEPAAPASPAQHGAP